MSIEDSEFPPPMLENEKIITDRVTAGSDQFMAFGFLTSSVFSCIYMSKLKGIFTRAGLRAWHLGPVSLVAGATFGAKLFHWSYVAPQIFSQLPEGYYRRVYVDNMDRSKTTKKAYFNDHPLELKARYQAQNGTLDLSVINQSESYSEWRSWSDVRKSDK